MTDFGYLLGSRGTATPHHCYHWAVSSHFKKIVKCSCPVALYNKWSIWLASKDSRIHLLLCICLHCTSISLRIYSKRCSGRIEASALISSSVWSTADTTAEVSGLLPLATINRNLRGKAEEATLEPGARRLSASRKWKSMLSFAAIEFVYTNQTAGTNDNV